MPAHRVNVHCFRVWLEVVLGVFYVLDLMSMRKTLSELAIPYYYLDCLRSQFLMFKNVLSWYFSPVSLLFSSGRSK